MNWDDLEGKWEQVKGSVKEQWGKLTDDDLEVIAAKKDQLVGRIQERYGISRDHAEREVDSWDGPETRATVERERTTTKRKKDVA